MKPFLKIGEDGRWSYRLGHMGIHRAAVSLEVDGQRRFLQRTLFLKAIRRISRLESSLSGGRIKFAVRFDAYPRRLILRGDIVNLSDRPVRLGKCCLLDLPGPFQGRLDLGRLSGSVTFLKATGFCNANRVVNTLESQAPLLSKVVGHIFNVDAGFCLNTSFLTFDRINTEILYDVSKGIYRAYCDFDGYELPQGCSVETEVLYVQLSDDPYRSLEAYADAVARHYCPRRWHKPPVGWVGHAWSASGFEHKVLDAAKAIRRRLKGFDIDYIWVSIANLEKGCPGNWLKTDRARFSHGMSWMAKKLKQLRFRLGLWVAPFWVYPGNQEQMRQTKDCLLRLNDDRPLVDCKKWSYGIYAAMPPAKRPNFYCLDGSHPQAVAYLRRIFRTYRQWGVRYYMLDFLCAGSGSTPGTHCYDRYHDRRMVKGPEVYRNALTAIRNAVGKDTYLVASSGPTFHNIGLIHAVRTGVDYGEGRAVNRQSWFFPATLDFSEGESLDYMSVVQNMAASWFAHNRWYLNDVGNVLTVDKPLPLNLARISATIFAICGGPMMLGDDVDRMCEDRLALIKRCLPRTPEAAVPVDLFSSAVAGDCPRVFRLPCATAWDRYCLVAVFNDRGHELRRTLSVCDLGLKVGQSYRVYDFWNDAYCGTSQDRFEFVVPPESVGFYRIHARRPHPWLLSTDLHMLQGRVEVPCMKWDSKINTLSGTAMRPKGEQGNLFFIAPEGWKPVSYEGLWVGKHKDRTTVVRKNLIFTTRCIRWAVAFERY